METDTISTLVRVSARLGAYDQLIVDEVSSYPRKDPMEVVKLLYKVNYEDPVGSDAEAVFRVGMSYCDDPQHSSFGNGVWRMSTTEERLALFREKSINQGLLALNTHVQFNQGRKLCTHTSTAQSTSTSTVM
jgi:hypothetical protein